MVTRAPQTRALGGAVEETSSHLARAPQPSSPFLCSAASTTKERDNEGTKERGSNGGSTEEQRNNGGALSSRFATPWSNPARATVVTCGHVRSGTPPLPPCPTTFEARRHQYHDHHHLRCRRRAGSRRRTTTASRATDRPADFAARTQAAVRADLLRSQRGTERELRTIGRAISQVDRSAAPGAGGRVAGGWRSASQKDTKVNGVMYDANLITTYMS